MGVHGFRNSTHKKLRQIMVTKRKFYGKNFNFKSKNEENSQFSSFNRPPINAGPSGAVAVNSIVVGTGGRLSGTAIVSGNNAY
jgi:hypothetical protein